MEYIYKVKFVFLTTISMVILGLAVFGVTNSIVSAQTKDTSARVIKVLTTAGESSVKKEAGRVENNLSKQKLVYTQSYFDIRSNSNFGLQKKDTTELRFGCDSGYVPVAGNPFFRTEDFCVMKYEAKCLSSAFRPHQDIAIPGGYNDQVAPCLKYGGSIVSSPQGKPIVRVTRATAQAYCASVGGHLITNNEWMTIARDTERLSENWILGVVNVGAMKYGNGEYGANNGVLKDGFDEGFGEYQRTLLLSTGEKIWDLSGNASELVDNSCLPGVGKGAYRPTLYQNLWWSLNMMTDYERKASGPYFNGTGHEWDHGGTYYGCSRKGNIFVRGGGVTFSPVNQPFSLAGAFSLYLGLEDKLTSEFNAISFRCVKPRGSL